MPALQQVCLLSEVNATDHAVVVDVVIGVHGIARVGSEELLLERLRAESDGVGEIPVGNVRAHLIHDDGEGIWAHMSDEARLEIGDDAEIPDNVRVIRRDEIQRRHQARRVRDKELCRKGADRVLERRQKGSDQSLAVAVSHLRSVPKALDIPRHVGDLAARDPDDRLSPDALRHLCGHAVREGCEQQSQGGHAC